MVLRKISIPLRHVVSPDMFQGWPWGASELNWSIIRYADLLLYKAEALIEIGGDGLEEARCVSVRRTAPT